MQDPELGEVFTESLPVKLRVTDVADRAAQLGHLMTDTAMFEKEIENKVKDLKGQLKFKEAEIARLGVVVRDGYERRQVEVVWQPDYATKMAELVRQDTFDVVRRRTLSQSELQIAMFERNRVESERDDVDRVIDSIQSEYAHMAAAEESGELTRDDEGALESYTPAETAEVSGD